MKERIVLIGGGGHCRACVDVIESEDRFVIAGVLDIKEKVGQTVLGYEIIGTDADIEDLHKSGHYFLITLGQIRSADKRIDLFSRLEALGAKLPVIVSPRAYLSKSAVVGRGTIVLHDALVNAAACVGRNCIINSKALVEHDAEIGDHCHVSTGAIVNGGAIIGSASFVGSNAVTQEYAVVEDKNFVPAATLVKRVKDE